tara:strand:- start:292 stop:477 length:186 start_codon:yes stop_codon:yes gene_type:complete
MNDEEALTKALVLAVLAPNNRVDEAVELAEELARRCSSDEVERAKAKAEELLNGEDDHANI